MQTTLEAMCGHAAFIADVMLQRGSTVDLPNLEHNEVAPASSVTIRFRQICDALAAAESDRRKPFAEELAEIEKKLPAGATVVVMVSAAEEGVANAIRRLSSRSHVMAFLYDPGFYSRAITKVIPSTDPDFMAALASPNVTLKVMPYPYAS